MPSCCRTCDHRESALKHPSPITLIDVALITLHFKTSITPTISAALNDSLNLIDSEDNTAFSARFISWSPAISDPSVAIILTTVSEVCSQTTSPVFTPLSEYLANPPSVSRILLNSSVLNLAASSPDERIPCDLILLHAPNPGVASAIGKRFGWDPKRSSLSTQLETCAPASFNRPGDLVRDFWAWAELSPEISSPLTPSSSHSLNSDGLGGDGILSARNADEKTLGFPDLEWEEEQRQNRPLEEETLVMLFQWSSLADAERFKHPTQSSLGLNGQDVASDLWDRCVAHPVRQMEGIGAKVETFKVELRGMEPRMPSEGRSRSGSHRLSIMATELGERMKGLWR